MNQAPVINLGAAALATISNNSGGVITFNQANNDLISISDNSTFDMKVQITATNGTVSLSGNNNLILQNNQSWTGTANVTFVGKVADAKASLTNVVELRVPPLAVST